MATILVTDDEADMRLALTNTLELAGYTVIDAGNGAEALDRLSKESIDLMLLDIQLPDMNGIQILRKVREEYPHIPVIMVTGFGSLETAVKTVQMGAADYLSKPFENKDLFQRIEKALGSRQRAAPSGPITSRLLKDLGVEEKKIEDEYRDEAAALRPTEGPPASRRWLWVLLAVLALAGGAGYYAYRWTASAEISFGIPTSHLSGIAWDGERLWLSDWFSQTVYECRLKGDQLGVHRSYHLADTRPTGLAASGDALYISDSWSQRLSKHALNADLSVVLSTPSAGKSPGGLFWDGRHLWSTDSAALTVFRHAPPDLRVEKRLVPPGTAPIGVTVLDGHVWVADTDTKRVYRYRIEEDFIAAGVYAHPMLREQTRPLSAFAVIGDHAWLGFEGDNRIYRIHMRRLKQIE